jgi:hypothetical protein
MEYIDCRLTVLKKRNERNEQLVSYKVAYAEAVPGTLRNDALTEMTVKRLNAWVGRHSQYCEKEDLQVLGLHLHHILFDHEKIGDAFKATYLEFDRRFKERRAQAPDKIPDLRLRLTLVFSEDEGESLAGYPWEFLFVPIPSIAEGFFLTGERSELILTRCVAQPALLEEKLFETERKELRILVAHSQPKELTILEESAIASIDQMINDIEELREEGRIHVKTVRNPTHQVLKDTVNAFKPHIVHLIGHGKEGKLALLREPADIQDEQVRTGKVKQAHWVDGDDMRAVFATFPPRLVFLDACNGATSSDWLNGFKSVARQSLQAGVPAVVAMQYAISNEDSGRFAKTFYQQIGEGMSIDEAVKEGRKVLGEIAPSWSHPRFGTPVVYLQSKDGIIFSKARIAAPGKTGAALTVESSGKVDCPYRDCTFKVSPGQRRCGCDRRLPLMQCPNPECGKVIPKDDVDCMFCEWKLKPSSPVPASTEALPAQLRAVDPARPKP